MDIVSLFLSIIAVSVTVYNCYRQYFKKTEGIALTISGALIENNELKVCLLYTNIGNQTATITNASILLDTNSLGHYSKENHASICDGITFSVALTSFFEPLHKAVKTSSMDL